ncbi:MULTISPECIES: hypothetical protein [unclassified Pseudomonas]|jgi:hypothetical protein|uniref:hypothetical protein n=1 Tax=unclassified Pseudomonas TaxID=196821 RepID=UPI0012E87A41|nr:MULTISPECIES: hypothetical protein [unclassified Pseudomonas]MBV7478473.1 hypothetical protein [Pseudomonas sp. PDM31]
MALQGADQNFSALFSVAPDAAQSNSEQLGTGRELLTAMTNSTLRRLSLVRAFAAPAFALAV